MVFWEVSYGVCVCVWFLSPMEGEEDEVGEEEDEGVAVVARGGG